MKAFNGRYGFIPYPGITECGDDFDTWAAKILRTQSGSVVADDRKQAGGGPVVQMSAHAARQAQDGPRGAMHGQVVGEGVAQVPSHPSKMFSRSDIMAIIRAEKARASRLTSLEQQMTTQFTCDSLITIFENLE